MTCKSGGGIFPLHISGSPPALPVDLWYSELFSSCDSRFVYSPPLSSDMRNRAAAAYVAEEEEAILIMSQRRSTTFQAHIPTPSFLECNNSVSGAVAPSPSIICAPSLSAANSHNTPAATLKSIVLSYRQPFSVDYGRVHWRYLWMFSISL